MNAGSSCGGMTSMAFARRGKAQTTSFLHCALSFCFRFAAGLRFSFVSLSFYIAFVLLTFLPTFYLRLADAMSGTSPYG